MSSRPDVIACWQAARETDLLKSPDEAHSLGLLPVDAAMHSRQCDQGPFFSLIITDEGNDQDLDASLASLLKNDLTRTQVLIVGSRERESDLAELLKKRGASAIVDLQNVGDDLSFAERRKAALLAANGEFVGFLSAGDLLEPNAIILLAAVALQSSIADIIFTDEDWTDGQGGKYCPRFKTGWDPDAHLGRDHLGQLCVMRRSRIEAVGGLRVEHDPAELYDLHCRVAFSISPLAIRHIPLILCHRGIPVGGAVSAKAVDEFQRSSRLVTQLAAEKLCGGRVTVTAAPMAPFISRIHWPLPELLPLVSILVPTRDRADLVKNCVEGLLTRTNYDNFEILLLDNESTDETALRLFADLSKDRRVRIIPVPGPFNFSRINNEGASLALGEILVFLNNDTEILNGGWLREMVSHALRPDIGCVGARLLYPDRRVQHAGIVLKPGPLAMHVSRCRSADEIGLDGQLAGTRTYAAVTAACLAMRRTLFERVGGFDQVNLQISFQDVDLCLKIEEKGFRNICTPFEPLIHLEGSSRHDVVTIEKQAREKQELRYLVRRWSDRFDDDRFGHPFVGLNWESAESLVPLAEGVDVLDLVR